MHDPWTWTKGPRCGLMLEGEGCRAEENKGEKWDNCNATINKIYLKKNKGKQLENFSYEWCFKFLLFIFLKLKKPFFLTAIRPACPTLGTWPATQACALTGNRTSDLLVCRPAFNPLSHTNQGKILIFLWQNISIILFCIPKYSFVFFYQTYLVI